MGAMTDTLRRLRFFRGGKHDCPYLPGRDADSAVADPHARMSPELLGQLTGLGFRRSGRLVYRPYCGDCHACVALRLPVDQFSPRRIQRRIARTNADLSREVLPAGFSEERFALYDRYLSGRHEGAGMDNPERDDFERFLDSEWSDTRFIEWRLDGKLVSVAVTDWLPNALSAAYTFFDPAMDDRSLGVFAVLQQVALAHEQDKEWVYLGYWIDGCRKMTYKQNFRPAQVYVNDGWRDLDSLDAGEGVPVRADFTG